jgi:Flp pilus assembly protein TadG
MLSPQLPAPTPSSRRPGCAARPRVAPWMVRDAGSMSVFGMLVFLTMLFVAGMAVDMMRVEHERVRMQGASDRAVLAATMLRSSTEQVTPTQIVSSFLAAEGLEGNLQERITITEQGLLRNVTVTPAARLPSMFMRLVGVDSLTLATPSAATEALGRIDFDIVMVLDVSGSMNEGTRFPDLREAAYAFASDMLAVGEPGQVAISFVPYSTEVILPQAVRNRLTNMAPATNPQTYDAYIEDGYLYPLYNAAGQMTWHSADHCIDFANWAEVQARMTNSVAQPWMRRFCNGWSNTSYSTPDVRPMMSNLPQIRAYLDAMGPVWGTNIDIGVRTGALFLDPSLRPAINDMIAAGQIPEVYANRPFDADRPNTVRAMILMTDGENCCYHAGDVSTRFATPQAHDLATTEACAGLRAQDVTIYSVAFEAPERGIDVLRNCASSPNHFFNTSEGGLVDAFRAIGTHIQIQALRLTQ